MQRYEVEVRISYNGHDHTLKRFEVEAGSHREAYEAISQKNYGVVLSTRRVRGGM